MTRPGKSVDGDPRFHEETGEFESAPAFARFPCPAIPAILIHRPFSGCIEKEKGLPLYEFVCGKCSGLCEFLVRNSQEKIELKCPTCGACELQRVISRVNSIVADVTGASTAGGSQFPVEERSCPSGTCSTITLPGHSH